MGKVFKVALLHTTILTAQTHLAILQHAHAIDTFVGLDREGLLHTESIRVRTLRDGGEGTIAFGGEEVALVVGKGNFSSLHSNGKC